MPMTVSLGVEYPATTPAPAPGPGMVVHSLFDLSRYALTEAHRRYLRAETGEELAAALRDMPKATVVFSELPRGVEPFAIS